MIVRQMKIQSETPRCSGLEHLGQGHHPTSWVGNAVSLLPSSLDSVGMKPQLRFEVDRSLECAWGQCHAHAQSERLRDRVPGPGCRSSISLGNSHGYLHFLDTWGQNECYQWAAEYRVPHMPHVYLAYYEYLVPQVP